MSLKGSKTEQNLKDAFAGESQANRRYLYFAAKADVEGQNDIATVFRSTAEGETGHAHGHLEYLEKEVKLGTKVNHIMRHTVGLYHGQIGSKNWKRYLSDNMMARDSDFQKAKHIMTIVQNNEKINQTVS